MDPTEKLRALLPPLLAAAPAPALLFSGGVRSSLLAALGAPRALAAVAVAVPGHALDEPFIARAAEALGITVFWTRPEPGVLADLLPQTIKQLRTFDPATLRAALVSHAGILLAKEFHLGSLWSGEASYLGQDGDPGMTPTEKLGHSLGVPVHTPLHHLSIRHWWGNLPPQEKTLLRHDRSWNQGPFRRLAGAHLPEEIVFRDPCPPEAGAGTGTLAVHWTHKISDGAFAREARDIQQEDGVALRDKEHLACYRLYRAFFGPPRTS